MKSIGSPVLAVILEKIVFQGFLQVEDIGMRGKRLSLMCFFDSAQHVQSILEGHHRIVQHLEKGNTGSIRLSYGLRAGWSHAG